MLSSSSHVKLGSFAYLLDQDIEGHYVHDLAPVEEDVMYWEMTDWIGGEGNLIYYVDEPAIYDYSGAINSREPGQVTVRPARTTDTTNILVTDQRQYPLFAVGDAALWLACGEKLYYSQNGTSWAAVTTGLAAKYSSTPPGEGITAIAGDPDFVYYAAWNKDTTTSTIVNRIDRGATSTEILADASASVPYVGLAPVAKHAGTDGDFLYLWTGRKLYQAPLNDSEDALPTVSRTLVFDTGTDVPTAKLFRTNWFAGLVPSEGAVLFFYANEGHSRIYEYRNTTAGRLFWEAPRGFTIEAMCIQLGICFVAGQWGGASNASGWASLYAIPLDTRRAVHVGYFRKHQNTSLTVTAMWPAYGGQILIAAGHAGHIFVYDMATDAITVLDSLTTAPGNGDGLTFTADDHRIGAVATYGNRRIAAVYQPGAVTAGTVIQVSNWKDDDVSKRESAMTMSEILYSPEWDFDYPTLTKLLIGFDVTFKVTDSATASGLIQNSRIIVAYSTDGGSNYTTAQTIGYTDTPSGAKGRVFIQAPTATSTVKFQRLKVRVTLNNNATDNVAPPVLYGVTVHAALASYEETWELALRTKDAQNSTRPANQSWAGEQARDELEDLMTDQQLVTLLDGFRKKKNNSYTTHLVRVTNVSDVIERNAEGTVFVSLRAVPS